MVASTFLTATTCGALALRRRAPHLLAGWFWFGLALGPVIGLVQIGAQSMADRYSYPSIIGIFIALVWSASELLRTKPQLARGLAAATLAGFAICSSIQALTFRNSEIAFRRAIAVTKDNETAYLNLGVALFGKGDFQGAKENDRQVVRVDPANPSGWGNLALAESRLGQEDDAISHYQKSLQLDPNSVTSLLFLGEILAKRSRNEEAEPLFLRLRQLEPQKLQPLAELTKLYTAQARWDDAVGVWAAYVAGHQGDLIGRQQLEAALARKQAAK
jgi:Flp pilus assembly protein TadD